MLTFLVVAGLNFYNQFKFFATLCIVFFLAYNVIFAVFGLNFSVISAGLFLFGFFFTSNLAVAFTMAITTRLYVNKFMQTHKNSFRESLLVYHYVKDIGTMVLMSDSDVNIILATSKVDQKEAEKFGSEFRKKYGAEF